jgi:hypothetical protein
MANKPKLNEVPSNEKQTAVKQTAVKQTAVKQTAVKQTAVKQTAVKQTAVKKTTEKQTLPSKKTNEGKFYVEYFVKAFTPKEEDYSGATIMEWFDTGREIDSIACPYDYSVSNNGFEVVWEGSYENIDSVEIVEEAVDQIKYWSNEFDASFKPNSHILLKDSKDNIVKKFIIE